MKILRASLCCGAAWAAASTAAAAEPASPVEAIVQGKPILEVRARYESVDQDGFAEEAEAVTVRTRFGWETAAFHGFKGLIEFEDVRDLGSGDYNDGVPPAEPFPVIADPEVTELNRLQLSWTSGPGFTGILGRQRINLDDQRFIGGVAWRQDEQTFDAARADFALGKAKVAVGYIDRVNRVFAEELDFDSESWFANATLPLSDLFTPTAFAYALDFEEDAPALSTITFGARIAGKAKTGSVGWAWTGTYATQDDLGDNPGRFTLDYWGADVAATFGPVTARAAYESLEGDGVRGFSTPLATLHAFQGWADVFLTTPAAGIEDANFTLTYKAPLKLSHLSGLTFMARYHDFEAELTGADLGKEWDVQAAAQITPRLSALAKFADYEGVPGFASREKLWLGFEFKL